MAINKNNPLTRNYSGAVANQVVYRTRGGKTYLSGMPQFDPDYVPSTEQKKLRMGFAKALRYAKTILANPALKAKYQAASNAGQRAFNKAVSDALLPPELSMLRFKYYNGQPGKKITVRAIDNFMVTRVIITLQDATGAVIEEGEALQKPNKLDWTYTTTRNNPNLPGTVIRATAYDLPGNKSVLEVPILPWGINP